MSRLKYQEKLASAISKRLNKKVVLCYSLDHSIDIYVPKSGIIVIVSYNYIHDEYEITVRAGYGRNPTQLELDTTLARAKDAASKVKG